MKAVARLAITSSQNRDTENDRPIAKVAPALTVVDTARVNALL
ncbi:Uncharacterised protein [Mycobacteroides abscessus subsp. abscessus]|nr:Uncharacterised protein [Mycobacteroides abscessus subsp. abscessus]SHX44337.1 Uncharacterised protein [Mycobacteroides abscessus subsp. abscessus]SKV41325.1 Uncharacterised protein [Mycobacteroides abscessus subsp. abscessus]